MWAIAATPSLIVTGRCRTAVDEARRAFAEQRGLPDQVALPGPGVHVVNQIWALAECGRLTESSGLAAAAYAATPATAPPDGLMWLSQQQGRTALLAGQVETARRWLEEALARGDAHNMSGARRLVLSLAATVHAYRGDAAAAAAAVAELQRVPPFAFARAEQDLGPAWARAAAGDLPGARQVLQAAADQAAATGYRTTEAWLLHDIARLGDPAAVADRLAELAAASRERPDRRLRRPRRGGRRRPGRRRWSRRPTGSRRSAPACWPPRPPPRRPRPSSAGASAGRPPRPACGRRH